MFGDIVKVTPTSKVVGDMALFMVANNLTPEEVLDPERELAFPESVVEFFEGGLGQPPGGFPEALQEQGAQGREPAAGAARRRRCRRPTSTGARPRSRRRSRRQVSDRELVSYLLYPQVFPDFAEHQRMLRRRRACCRRRCSSTAWSRARR